MIEPFGNAIISYVIFPLCKQCFDNVLHNLVLKKTSLRSSNFAMRSFIIANFRLWILKLGDHDVFLQTSSIS
jgi:hypothetical protein